MTPLEQEEFRALRATIRERGTARVVLFVAALGTWGALAVATAAAISLPEASLIPLAVLAAGFEATASLHLGVERIGRYLQARFEEAGAAATGARWETVAMEYGARFGGARSDPLFATVYTLAAIVNFVPVALTGVAPEIVALGAMHALLLWRVRTVARAAATQRTEDLRRFRELLGLEVSRIQNPESRRSAE
jgi:hypothetical protein